MGCTFSTKDSVWHAAGAPCVSPGTGSWAHSEHPVVSHGGLDGRAVADEWGQCAQAHSLLAAWRGTASQLSGRKAPRALASVAGLLLQLPGLQTCFRQGESAAPHVRAVLAAWCVGTACAPRRKSSPAGHLPLPSPSRCAAAASVSGRGGRGGLGSAFSSVAPARRPFGRAVSVGPRLHVRDVG